MSETSNESVTTATEKKKAAPKKPPLPESRAAKRRQAKPASKLKTPRQKESSVITDAETFWMIEEAAYYVLKNMALPETLPTSGLRRKPRSESSWAKNKRLPA